MSRHLVSDEAEFERILAHARAVFDLPGSFPAVRCQIPGCESFFFDYDHLTGRPGWYVLQKLAALHSDREVDVLVLDPDPAAYYHHHFGEWQAFTLPVTADADEYWAAISEGPPAYEADALVYHAKTWVAAGASAAWGVWNEHDLTISVAFSRPREGLDAWSQDPEVSTLSRDKIEQIMCLNFPEHCLPDRLLREFRDRFPSDQA